MIPAKFSDENYADLNNIFSGGDISSSTKADLELYSIMLSRPNAYLHFSKFAFSQLCDTVRTLLIVRISEEQNIQAKKESRLALIIACVALIAGIVQAGLAYLQYASTQPVQVTASTPLPVRMVETNHEYVAHTLPEQKTTEPKLPEKKK